MQNGMKIQIKQENCPSPSLRTKSAVHISNDPVKLFFDVAYFLCICPFRFTIMKGSYMAVSWLPQQVICGFITTLCIVKRVARIRLKIFADHSKDASALIETSREIVAAVHITFTLVGFWFRQDIYAKIVNGKLNNAQYSSPKVTSKTTSGLFRTFCIGTLLLSQMSSTMVSTLISTLSWTPRCFAADARFTFFLERHVNCTAAILETGPHTSVEILWSFAGVVVLYIATLGFHTSSMCIFVHVWSLYDSISERTGHWLSQTSQETVHIGVVEHQEQLRSIWRKIIDGLKESAKFSHLINTVISTQLAMNIVDVTCYFPVHISKTLRSDGVINTPSMVLELIRFWLMLVMAAEVKAKVKECINEIATESHSLDGFVDNFPS